MLSNFDLFVIMVSKKESTDLATRPTNASLTRVPKV